MLRKLIPNASFLQTRNMYMYIYNICVNYKVPAHQSQLQFGGWPKSGSAAFAPVLDQSEASKRFTHIPKVKSCGELTKSVKQR